jgi:anti-sigma factor ChrR (cupin superfamily)
MMTGHSPEEGRDLAALYTLGALRGDELREFERHLTDGCEMCAAEIAAFAPVVVDLAYCAPPQTPRSELRSRLLECIAAEGMTAAHPTIEKDRLLFVGSRWLNWQPGNAPGVEMKLLSVDKERGYFTTLVRLAPGASLAPHRHADVEESYIMEGELLVSGMLMRVGDYCRAEAGSLHTGVTSKTGCTFIAVASMRDEWFELGVSL